MYLAYDILTWHRYIDDTFILWEGPFSLLDKFMQALGRNSFNRSFTMDCSSHCILFLDILIHKDDLIHCFMLQIRIPSLW